MLPSRGRYSRVEIPVPQIWTQPWGTSLVAQMVKRLPTIWETRLQSMGQEDLLEKEMATHFNILAWKNPTDGETW